MQTQKRYAIYGGSFDPIHNGHVALADSAVKECGINNMIFMPAYMSPFKQDKKTTAGKDRCGMIEAVLRINPAFSLSRYELNKGGASYTIETLRHWERILDGELCFVLGYDSIVQLDKWYEGETILRNYHLITGRRPGTDDAEGMQIVEQFRQKYASNITVLEMAPVDASSTQIRNMVKAGETISGLVPSGVEEYIIEHKLYR